MTEQTFEYWIDIGRTNGQYTLHRRLTSRPTHWAVKEYTYIRNVGRVYDEAVARADKYIDENHPEGFGEIRDYAPGEGGALRHPSEYDDTRLWFGKYAGADLDDVVANDVEYLKYLRDNFDRIPGKPRMTSFLKKLDAMELGESERDIRRREQLAEREVEAAAYEARKQPIAKELEDGRATFTGTIIAIYQRETMYGIVDKMIFEDDRGFKLTGTAPRALWNDDDRNPKGCEIQFDAALTISDDDPSFGFFKRPTKIQITNEERT